MKLKSLLLIGGVSLGITVSTAAMASVSNFQAIEQPLEIKLGVSIMGLGLIVLELWWFLAKQK
ncbi:hypothetical protein N836_30225 [Leptolyngbya sp. Heron Island J]|uniref:hypothetical protein n=1 Tax=Leptolyngbya sp. Heron Island J TaxID=1385935 RepID=UPI0003B94B92|nr:hypothetical protein [Leptolyngbya sp. Heron Island J]ESA38806.1 hypothetical protein N836_30225 [Leptolyngbya sp. Heron Island J]